MGSTELLVEGSRVGLSEGLETVDVSCPRDRGNGSNSSPKKNVDLGDDAHDMTKDWIKALDKSVLEQKGDSEIVKVVVELTAPHRILAVSHKWTETFGTAESEVCGRGFSIAFGPKTNTSIFRRVMKNVSHGHPSSGSTFFYDRDGVPQRFMIKGCPLSQGMDKGTKCMLSLVADAGDCASTSVEASTLCAVFIGKSEPYLVKAFSTPFQEKYKADITAEVAFMEQCKDLFEATSLVEGVREAVECNRAQERRVRLLCSSNNGPNLDETVYVKTTPVQDGSQGIIGVTLEFLEGWEVQSLASSTIVGNDGPVSQIDFNPTTKNGTLGSSLSSADTVMDSCRVYMLLHQGYIFPSARVSTGAETTLTFTSSCGTVVTRSFKSNHPLCNEVVELELESPMSIMRVAATMGSQPEGRIAGSADLLLTADVLNGFTDDWVHFGDSCKFRLSFSFDQDTIQALKCGLTPQRSADTEFVRLKSSDMKVVEQVHNSCKDNQEPMDLMRFKSFSV